jgi:hypothetical protein
MIIPHTETTYPNISLLSTGLTGASILSKARIALDFGDSACYTSGSIFTNLKSGEANYTKDSSTALEGPASTLYSRVRTTSQQGWIPSVSTRTWSDLLHKANGVWSWCALINVRTCATYFPLFGTWDNTTGNTGILVYLDFRKTITTENNITVSAWRSASSSALTLYFMSNKLIRKNDWIFISCSFGHNVSSFCRSGNRYVPVNKYRRGTLTLDAGNTNTITQTYSSPTTTNAADSLQLLGIPGTTNDHGDVEIAMLSIFDQYITESEFNNVFNSVRARYGL